VKYAAEKSRSGGKAPTPADPIPIPDWETAVSKRVSDLATSPLVGLKQTVKVDGKMKDNQVAFNAEEATAKRFEFPAARKGTSPAEIGGIEREFSVPPIRPDIIDEGLSAMPFLDEIMRDYKADVPLDEIEKNKDKYKLRATTMEALDLIRKTWTVNPNAKGVTQLREAVKAPINDALKKEIANELDAWAEGIARFELLDIALDALMPMRDSEPKRWQANFDYARATVKARLAFMNEYNKLMGDVRTETLPPLDMKLGQDQYRLASSETMKNKKGAEKLASEAKEIFEKLIAEHKGTPWAIQAKRDRSVSLGLVWRPASSAKATPDP
jgi:hypothetical protein